MLRTKLTVAATITALALIGGGVATAIAATNSSSGPIVLCVQSHTRALSQPKKNHSCRSGSFAETINRQGPRGKTGATGATGAAGQPGPQGSPGPQGPSGVTAVTNQQLVQASDSNYNSTNGGDTISTGGSFTRNASDLATTLNLPAGSYLVSLSFTATPDEVSSGAVFPQMMVYDGPVNSTFSNDLFNVGAGALEDPASASQVPGDVINSYFSGSAEITVPAGGETLDFYAFGYDSDTGAGSYTLNSAVVTATQLQTSS